MSERRVVALALVVAGVWVQWGPGLALIVAGVGWGAADVELAPRAVALWERLGRGWARVRAVAATVPRRTAAAVLVALAAACLPAAAWTEWGLWAALGTFGALSLVYGAVLGWE